MAFLSRASAQHPHVPYWTTKIQSLHIIMGNSIRQCRPGGFLVARFTFANNNNTDGDDKDRNGNGSDIIYHLLGMYYIQGTLHILSHANLT